MGVIAGLILFILLVPLLLGLIQVGLYYLGYLFVLWGLGSFALGVLHWYYMPKLALMRGADISTAEALGNVYTQAEGIPFAWQSRMKAKGFEALNQRLQEEIEFLRRVREYKREYARRREA
jgi:hypothetical protein